MLSGRPELIGRFWLMPVGLSLYPQGVERATLAAPLVMTRCPNTAAAVLYRNAHILHHALVLVIENLVMQHEFADVTLVAGARNDRVQSDDFGGLAGSSPSAYTSPIARPPLDTLYKTVS